MLPDALDANHWLLNVANGTAAVDLSINVPITNGGLTKLGPGTLALVGGRVQLAPDARVTYDGIARLRRYR